jgi:hypothetical protein
MENIVSLPQYDVLAYLVAGLATFATADLLFDKRIFFRGDWNVSVTTTIVIAAYVTGHVLAVASTLVIESGIVHGPMSFSPAVDLMDEKACNEAGGAFSAYFGALQCSTQKKIQEKLAKEDRTKDLKGTQLFWEAYNNAKQDEDAFKRIVTFHQQYNFSRNMSFVALLAVLVLILHCKYRFGISPNNKGIPHWLGHRWILLAVFFFVGVTLFARYLYFYRAYSIEVLTSYAYATEAEKKKSVSGR